MSLINQMLRDLEHRNATVAKSAPIVEARAPATRRAQRPVWIVLTMTMALPAAYFWYQGHSAAPAPQPAVASTQTTTSPAPTTQPLPAAAPAATVATSAEIRSIQPANAVSPEPEPEQSPPASGDEPRDIKPEINTTASPTPKTVTPKPTPIDAQPPTGIAKRQAPPGTLRQHADVLYRQAQSSRSMLMAQENLQEALALDPLHLPARTLLLQTLLKSRATTQEIGEFAEQSLSLFPGNLLFVKTLAHWQIQRKNHSAALQTLERVDAETVDDPAYLALLAASFQQLQRYPQAEPIYRRLTQMQADKAEPWLGLAICQDKLNQTQAAEAAYRQALDKNTLNPEVVSYIKQRLGAQN